MKIFNKTIALLIVTSFITSDNIYAALHRDDLGDRSRGVRRTQPTKPRKNIKPADIRAAKRTQSPRIRTKIEAEQAKKKQLLQTAKRRKPAPAPKKPLGKRELTGATQLVKPVPNNTPKNRNVGRIAQPKAAPVPNNTPKNRNVGRIAQPKAAPVPNNTPKNAHVARTPQSQTAPTPNNNAKRVTGVKSPIPNNIKNVQATPTHKTSKASAGVPNYYIIKPSDFSDDLKKDVKNFLGMNSSESHKWSQGDLQDRLKIIEDLEKEHVKTPDPVWTKVGLRNGTTQRLRNAFKAKYGYEEVARAATPVPNNPAKGGNAARIAQAKSILIPDNNATRVNVARAPQPQSTPAPNKATKKVTGAKVAQPQIRPAPNNAKKSPQTKGPQYYVIKTRDLPEDLKKDLKLFGLNEGMIDFKVSQLRKRLADIQLIENAAPGSTETARQHLNSIGYNPNGSGKINIVTSRLPKKVKDMMEMAGDDLPPTFYISQTLATRILSEMQHYEARLPGVTERIRAFLKKQYGFQD